MSVEFKQEFSQLVKRVEFFPYEWSSNLVAVCFSDSVKFFVLVESAANRKEEADLFAARAVAASDATSSSNPLCLGAINRAASRSLQPLATVPFQQKIEYFSWSPKTSISSLKQSINFAVSDCSQNLVFCHFALNESVALNSVPNVVFLRETVDCDCIFDIAYDSSSGELLAFTADNCCFLWDCVDNKMHARFLLQSPGANICWNRNEKTKLMVAEKSGTIRIYSIETLKPVYTLAAGVRGPRTDALPFISFDWCEANPEFIIGNTSSALFVWNTSKSCLPEKVVENFARLKAVRLSRCQENIVGFIDGKDVASKLTVMNLKTNQVIYQTDSLKLLSSFSFNCVQPIILSAHEQQLVVIKTFA